MRKVKALTADWTWKQIPTGTRAAARGLCRALLQGREQRGTQLRAYGASTVLKDVGEAQRQAGQECLLTKLSHSTAHNSYKLNSPGVAGGGGRKKFTVKDFLSLERKRSE